MVLGLLATVGVAAAISTIALSTSSRQAPFDEKRIRQQVQALVAGIPQHARTLGRPHAPVTLQIYIDLKDPDSREWFLTKLPSIIDRQVRTGTLKLEYHAYKTNTFRPEVFVREQTAALAAGAQYKLWNYILTFYHEQKSEFEAYVTNTYLTNIAKQIPDLNLTQWQADRHDGRREEQTTSEDQTARTLNLHVTPSFRIGPTHHPLHNYSGTTITKYGHQNPIALPTNTDMTNAINEILRTSH